MIQPGKILGVRQGGEPDDYLNHFYACKQCGQLVYKRDLGPGVPPRGSWSPADA
jgi:hypothetical protein